MNSSYASHLDSSFNTPTRRRKISGALASKIQSVVPMESPGQPRKYKEADSSVLHDVLNNSDEEGEPMEGVENTFDMVEEEINTADGRINHSSPKRDVSDWKVLRSLSTNSTSQPLSLTKTTTTTTTRTVSTTLSSSPSTPKIPKSRSSTKISSGILPGKNQRIHSGGIRKVSGKKF
ncbi:hypothetical protein OXX80_007575 [Metschnikowia pulcherrima]